MKPCPFCQGEATLLTNDDGTYDIACLSVGCFLEFGAQWHLPLVTIEEMWDRRPEDENEK